MPRLTAIGAAVGAAAGALVALLLLAFRRLRVGGRAGYDRRMPDDQALEQLVARLEARLVARESALAARERDLQDAIAELRTAQAAAAVPPDDSDLVRREQRLEERIAAVTRRELKVARRAAELEAEARSGPPGRRDPSPSRSRSRSRSREPEPASAVEATAAAEPRPAGPAPGGRYNLLTLEKLVEEKQDAFPDRADDWTSYLFFLREYASSDGTVPATFDWLIQDTFAELVS